MTPPADREHKKLSELVLYVAARSEHVRHFGLTKLHKILFFSDFRCYRDSQKTITGATYVKAKYGPVAKELDGIIDELQERGEALVVRRVLPVSRYEQKRLVPLRRPELGQFSGFEIAVVETVMDELRDLTAEDVSKLSHEFVGWKLAEMGEIIPPDSAFSPDPDDPQPVSRELAERVRQELEKTKP
jgi:hypothetical protein